MIVPTVKIRTDTANDPRWQKILTRDSKADGLFWYSVATTGVYCRPSCPSRTARPENVTLHDTLASARASGCRACKRCNPEDMTAHAANSALIAQACRLISETDTPLTLAALASAVQLSPGYFHRLFKTHTGLTPKAYAQAQRARIVREALAGKGRVTDAIYEAGFSSNGHFYEQSTAILGMTPQRFQQGGQGEVLHFAVGQCSLGAILVASSAKGVVSILLGDDPSALLNNLQDRFPQAKLIGADTQYEQTIALVIGFIEAPQIGLTLPLDIRGTAFQQRVWQALRDIPPGRTMTYSEIANRIGVPRAVRAVASACAANHIAVAIPCHRVIRIDGSLSGYRWGIDRKQTLLSREQFAAEKAT